MWNTSPSEIEKELAPEERLLWSGQPRGGLRLRCSDGFIIPFSILWCSIAIHWEVIAVTAKVKEGHQVSIAFPLVGVLFVLVGLYLLFGRFIVDARTRGRTFYGITNSRIIIVVGLFSRHTKSLDLRPLNDISLTEHSDGSGSIVFGQSPPFGLWFTRMSLPVVGCSAPLAFDMIDQAKEVYEIIKQAQKTTA